MNEPPPAVEVRGLAKRFGTSDALTSVDFRLGIGEFLAMFGPNGAGKTTLIRILATITRPTSGSVRILGEETAKAGAALRSHIGLVSHQSFLYPGLSALQNVTFFAKMFDVPSPRRRAEELLTALGLEHRMDDPIGTYSRGMEQRCAIARALVHEPKIILLDEPYTGLDPDASTRLTELLAEMHDGTRTIIVTSHDLSHGADLADRIAVLARGRLAYETRAAEVPGGDLAEAYRAATRGQTP